MYSEVKGTAVNKC